MHVIALKKLTRSQLPILPRSEKPENKPKIIFKKTG